jgi:uncharacterized OsmC-like protein
MNASAQLSGNNLIHRTTYITRSDAVWVVRLNSVDLEKVGKTVEEIKADPNKAVRTVQVEGHWVTDGRSSGAVEYQFVATCRTEKGTFSLEVDSPGFMGGGGNRPGPMHYCLVGMASCFLATLVGVASERGIRLNRAGVKAYCELDFRKPLGLGNNPIVRSVRFDLQIEADIDRSETVKLVEEAKERCPAIYSLRTPIEPLLNLL